MKLDRINVGSIDFGIGVLRGVLGSDVRGRFSATMIACIEQSIESMRGAARYVERAQRSQRRGR